MKEEVEIKVILKNPKQIENFLQKNAKLIKEKNQKDQYFIPKHEDFFAENPTLKYLRVRHEQGKHQIAYHFCHFSNDKTIFLKTDEYETNVENPEMATLIFEKLDMKNKVTVTKHRKSYSYKDFIIELDHVEELGYFLEIEAKNLLNSVKETKERCFDILKELNADWEKTPNMGYPDMILMKE